MAFRIIEGGGEKPVWCSTDGSSTYYVGQLVTLVAASKAHVTGTVKPLAVPAGAADTTNFQIPYGVVVAINNRLNPTFNTTGEYATGVTTQANQLARDWAFQEGMYIKGDPQVIIRVERINPNTVLRGNIYNATLGTATTVVTDTGGADTTGYTSAGTTGACDFTPVANLASIYCRTGANAGMYRVTSDTSTTAPAVTVGFPYDVALGDTFVRVPLKQGFSMMYIAGPGLFIDSSKLDSSNTFHTVVHSLDLSKAGQETADFSFCLDHFSFARA